MSASREIELKFLCAPRDLATVLAAAPAGDDESRELISVYFDTPDLRLQKAGVSLRVRQSKSGRTLTMKRGDGLAREEYETPLQGDAPPVELAPLREVLSERDAAALAPAYNVRVMRRQRLIRFADAEIELACDQGEVSGGRLVSPICEVELELKSGTPAALFRFARELSGAAPLYLSFDTKSARGQALAAGKTLRDHRGEAVSLKADASVADAFQAIARKALAQIAANAAALREAPDPEAVHQLRVAVRRLRTALSTFRTTVVDGGFEAIKSELRWLSQALDSARNLDVFSADMLAPAEAMETPPTGLPALVAAVQTARDSARQEASDTAGSDRFRALMIDAVAWVETGDWLAAEPGRESARPFAARALAYRWRRLLRRGRRVAKSDDAARHKLRIEAKKLRYAAEGFVSLFPTRKVERFIGKLKILQDALGALNDIATAETLMAGLPLTAEAAFAAGEIEGLRLARKPKLVDQAARAMDRLGKAEPFWA